jgi:CRISPR-associated endonuclease/helicase Cas3
MNHELIAHVRKNEDETWATPHGLLEHLLETSKLSEIFANKFNSGEWGKVLGLAHDAGKGRLEWQHYLQKKSGYFFEEAHLEGKSGKIPHSIHGAELVENLFGKYVGRLLAYCIAGHHTGLPDWSSSEGEGQASLEFQKAQIYNLEAIESSIINNLSMFKPSLPPWKFDKGLDLSLWIRMLYSCLVDADFLDTEKYMDIIKTSQRGNYCSIEELHERFNKYVTKLEDNSDSTNVNMIRSNIRQQCVNMAKEQQGIFTLSVPTGGGKTLSSLTFALEHAKIHSLNRVIYVIPYTSIIEQNAEIFKSALGEDQVIEHHSNIVEDDNSVKSRLSAENWDATVIVTTTIQFFESLFASRPGKCRKLHNIVESVIILDEAQMLPIEYLSPILETMQLLVDRYKVSFVICTATQPAFKERMSYDLRFPGLKNTKEIMGNDNEVSSLYASLKRNNVNFPNDINKITPWEEIAEKLISHRQVLCIVSDRRSCRDLYKLMPKRTFHLSALMCGQHRSEKISIIKESLKKGEPIKVISTQLVEAGVDFDFPVVYRALAGLDSIAQAAGRCNREGKLPNGNVVVFNPPRKPPEGVLRKACDITKSLIGDIREEFADYNIFTKYFEELYWKANSLDKEGILKLLDPYHNDIKELSIYFRTASKRFKIIDDSNQKSIIVRFGQGDSLINKLKTNGPDRFLMRKLQRYTVNIYTNQFNEMKRRGAIEEVFQEVFALSSRLDYSDEVGLLVDEHSYNPEDFII